MQQHRNAMQPQKQEQAKPYNRNARDLPSLRTGDTVYVQLVPNMRRWAQGRVTERVNARSYKVKTMNRGTYIRNQKFIKIRNANFEHSLQNATNNMAHEQNTTYTERPK